jgi:16S rRNA processing protein RimM
MDDLLLIGRVARSHGNRGQVIIDLETDFADERFKLGGVVLLGSPAGGLERRTIREVRFHRGRPIVGFEGVETMDAAEALAGTSLHVPLTSVGPLPAGTYHHHELVGCDVLDTSGAQVGRVTAVEGPMELSRLVVSDGRGEILIPLAAHICVTIDPAGRRIVVDPPEGLIELNRR